LGRLSGAYPLGLVTNGAPDAKGSDVESLSLPAYFDTMVFAGHETPPKPAPEPFRRALADLGVAPDRAVHVGDSLATDVAGAARAGLSAIRLRAGDGDDPPSGPDPNPDPETHRPALTVDSLSRLERLFAGGTIEPERSG
jgi:putative hydrolase of the HAD superfamily